MSNGNRPCTDCGKWECVCITDTRTRLRILCDADGVLADFVGLVLEYVQRHLGLSYRREAVDTWEVLHLKCLGIVDHEAAFTAWCDAGAGERMLPLPGAEDFWRELCKRAAPKDLKVCTAPFTDEWYPQRSRWVQKHFGVSRHRLIFTGAKHELVPSWDVLIDDKVENCVDFVKAGGVAFCIEAAYNAHVPAHIPRGDWRACLAWLDSFAEVVP